MNKLKTKYNDLAKCKIESLSISIALLAIYKPLLPSQSFHKTEKIT